MLMSPLPALSTSHSIFTVVLMFCIPTTASCQRFPLCLGCCKGKEEDQKKKEASCFLNVWLGEKNQREAVQGILAVGSGKRRVKKLRSLYRIKKTAAATPQKGLWCASHWQDSTSSAFLTQNKSYSLERKEGFTSRLRGRIVFIYKKRQKRVKKC